MNESWLRAYLRYTEGNEAPTLFHFWTGVSVISACLGRKVWIRRGHYTLYPNFFTILVAGSARCRKTTSINIGVRLLRAAELETINIMGEGKTSTEKFIIDQKGHLASTADDDDAKDMLIATFVVADELSDFLTKDSQGDKLINALTKLFDCPDQYKYRTIHGHNITLVNVFTSVLAGTQKETLGKVLPDTAFGGGFASRIMFVYQADTDRSIPWPVLSPDDEALERSLIQRLQRIGRMAGEFTPTPAAKEYFAMWYGKLENPEDSRMDGFFGRKHDHVLRMSMVLKASQSQEDMQIEVPHIKGAIEAIEGIEGLMNQAFGDVGTADHKVIMDRALKHLHRAGSLGISHSMLLKRMYGYADAPTFRILIQTLLENGMVRRDPEKMSYYQCMCEICAQVRPT